MQRTLGLAKGESKGVYEGNSFPGACSRALYRRKKLRRLPGRWYALYTLLYCLLSYTHQGHLPLLHQLLQQQIPT